MDCISSGYFLGRSNSFLQSVNWSLCKGQAHPDSQAEIDQHPDKFTLSILRIVSLGPMEGKIRQPFPETGVGLSMALVDSPPGIIGWDVEAKHVGDINCPAERHPIHEPLRWSLILPPHGERGGRQADLA